MTDIIAMHRADLVGAVTAAVRPLKAERDALAAELAGAKRELAIAGGPVLLANKMLVERDAASIARIATLEKSLRDIKFNAGNKTGYGLIWQIAALALGSEQETKGVKNV